MSEKLIKSLKITPPPIIFMVGFLVGWLGHLFFAPPILPKSLSFVLGWLLVVFSFLIIFPVLRQFHQAKTPFNVRQQPNQLVTSGLFRYSRNPSYLSLVMLYVGVAVLMNSFTIMLLFIPCFLLVDRLVIPHEELNLEAKFGSQYKEYKSSVRRWL